jgi:hypothetical protein
MKRTGCLWLLVGAVVSAVIAHVLLSALPNRDDAAVEVIQRAGGKVRRTPRIFAPIDAELYAHGDVWGVELRRVELNSEVSEHLLTLRSMSYLDISSSTVTAGRNSILIPPSEKIQQLFITYTNVSDHHISSLRDCPNLTQLILVGTDVSDASVSNILECRKLRYIVLQRNSMTEAGLAAIRAGFPAANVETRIDALQP